MKTLLITSSIRLVMRLTCWALKVRLFWCSRPFTRRRLVMLTNMSSRLWWRKKLLCTLVWLTNRLCRWNLFRKLLFVRVRFRIPWGMVSMKRWRIVIRCVRRKPLRLKVRVRCFPFAVSLLSRSRILSVRLAPCRLLNLRMVWLVRVLRRPRMSWCRVTRRTILSRCVTKLKALRMVRCTILMAPLMLMVVRCLRRPCAILIVVRILLRCSCRAWRPRRNWCRACVLKCLVNRLRKCRIRVVLCPTRRHLLSGMICRRLLKLVCGLAVVKRCIRLIRLLVLIRMSIGRDVRLVSKRWRWLLVMI